MAWPAFLVAAGTALVELPGVIKRLVRGKQKKDLQEIEATTERAERRDEEADRAHPPLTANGAIDLRGHDAADHEPTWPGVGPRRTP